MGATPVGVGDPGPARLHSPRRHPPEWSPSASTSTASTSWWRPPRAPPKIAAIEANPHVAVTIDTDTYPPVVLQIRGTATVSMVHGVCDEYLAASRKLVPVDQWDAFEDEVTALYERMARIEITPTWATVFDFQTRAPKAIMELAAAKGM